MKSPQVVQQLRNHQDLRRKQFLQRCRAAGHTKSFKSSHTVERPCSATDRHTSCRKPAGASDVQSPAFHAGSSMSDPNWQVMNPAAVSAMNTSETDTTYSCTRLLLECGQNRVQHFHHLQAYQK